MYTTLSLSLGCFWCISIIDLVYFWHLYLISTPKCTFLIEILHFTIFESINTSLHLYILSYSLLYNNTPKIQHLISHLHLFNTYTRHINTSKHILYTRLILNILSIHPYTLYSTFNTYSFEIHYDTRFYITPSFTFSFLFHII